MLVRFKNLNESNFPIAWMLVEEEFKSWGVHIDPKSNNIAIQNIISYDENIYINENSMEIDADEIACIPYTDDNEKACIGYVYEPDTGITIVY